MSPSNRRRKSIAVGLGRRIGLTIALTIALAIPLTPPASASPRPRAPASSPVGDGARAGAHDTDDQGFAWAAQGGARPRECAPPSASGARTIWDDAVNPGLVGYCDALASGYARLRWAPRAALAAADRADELSPGRAAPSVLRGRALAATGDFAGVVAALTRARATDPHALDDPGALWDLATGLSRTGRLAEALVVYQALAPRAALLPAAESRSRALVDGGEVALALGPDHLADAIILLTAARTIGTREGRGELDGMLALALERKGRMDEAASILLEVPSVQSSADEASSATMHDAAAAPGGERADAVTRQRLAGRALLEERLGRREVAVASWQAYLAAAPADDPWTSQAREHLTRLRAGSFRKGGSEGRTAGSESKRK